MKKMTKTQAIHERTEKIIPGQHSNLPGYELFSPVYITHGKGSRIWDIDSNEYLDFMSGLGAGILGYGHEEYLDAVKKQLDNIYYMDPARRSPLEIEVAEKLHKYVPSAQRVRFLLTGTEAVQLVIRLSRAFTGRNLFIRFDGHYHGSMDNVLGGNVNTDLEGPPYGFDMKGDIFATLGRDPHALRQSFKIPWNDIEFLKKVLEKYGEQIALILMEPVNCNGGSCWPKPGYLERVRELCDKYGIVLCFDEIITGFRMGLGGAQSVLGVVPDLTTFGKAIAGGIPFSAVVGRADIMDLMTKSPKVICAGTFNSYPLGLAAANATIGILEKDDGALYKHWDTVQARLTEGFKEIAVRHGFKMLLQFVRGCIFYQFADLTVAHNMGDWMPVSDHVRQEKLRSGLVEEGAFIIFRGRWFVNSSITNEDVDLALEMTDRVMKRIK